MEQTRLNLKDEFGIIAYEHKMPYFGIRITEVEAKQLENTVAGIYEIDSRQMFEVKGKSGERMLFVVFVKKSSELVEPRTAAGSLD